MEHICRLTACNAVSEFHQCSAVHGSLVAAATTSEIKGGDADHGTFRHTSYRSSDDLPKVFSRRLAINLIRILLCLEAVNGKDEVLGMLGAST